MMCLICSLKPACEAGDAGGDGKTKTWCRNLISAVPCCAYAHMPGQSDYGTLDRRHQAERETARYIVLRSTQYWRVLILKDTAKPCRMKKRNVRPYYIYNSTFGLALALFSLHSSLIWSFSTARWPRLLSLPLLITLRPPRCVSTGSVAVRLAEMAI
jgi:hypothetical protein